MRRAAVSFLLPMLAACASAPVPARCGETATEAWCTGTFPGPTPPPRVVNVADVADARAALARACPAPSADDPTPGLSAGARAPEARPGRACPSLPVTELHALYWLLQTTPRNAPDRPKLLYRIAAILFSIERSWHVDCREMVALPDPPPERRADFVERAERTIRGLYAGRASGAEICTQILREHPDAVPALCTR